MCNLRLSSQNIRNSKGLEIIYFGFIPVILSLFPLEWGNLEEEERVAGSLGFGPTCPNSPSCTEMSQHRLVHIRFPLELIFGQNYCCL